MSPDISLDDIKAAAVALGDTVARTPLVPSQPMSGTAGCSLKLKLENLQNTGSFKARGAGAKLASLGVDATKAGIVAASAGNHAQGCAYHARRLGIPATIVMPTDTPFSKIERSRALGATVVLQGDSVDAAATVALAMAERDDLAFIHPYDDPHIIAGQGTIGLELIEEWPDLDTIVVPIGGGGLIAGIAIAVKAMKPTARLIGVEAALFPSMSDALQGRPPTSGGTTIADGIAVKEPGRITRAIIQELVDDVVAVDEPALEDAVARLAETQKVVAEGAGAAALAAVLSEPDRFVDRNVVAIVSGGNIDCRLLAELLNRSLVRDGRLVRLRIGLVDRPGMLGQIADIIGAEGGNIIEINHQRLFYDVPARQAEIDAIIETRNVDHVRDIVAALIENGHTTRVLSSRSSDNTSA
jgi:threonine dehydratase